MLAKCKHVPRTLTNDRTITSDRQTKNVFKKRTVTLRLLCHCSKTDELGGIEEQVLQQNLPYCLCAHNLALKTRSQVAYWGKSLHRDESEAVIGCDVGVAENSNT